MPVTDEQLPRLIAIEREHLARMVLIAEDIFPTGAGPDAGPTVRGGAGRELHLMLLAYAGKQLEHARAVLRLDDLPDSMLIARSMLEGWAQIIFARQDRSARPARWLAFFHVADFRTLHARRAAGHPMSPEQEALILERVRVYGEQFLTRKARRARASGSPLPPDPYSWGWYDETEREVFEAAGAESAFRGAYGYYSEWHHWRPGAFGRMLTIEGDVISMTPRSPRDTATSVMTAFVALWGTLGILNVEVLRGEYTRALAEAYGDRHAAVAAAGLVP